MAKKGRLLSALEAHQGRIYSSEKQKKQEKQARKRKQENASRPEQDAHDSLLVENDGGIREQKFAKNQLQIDVSGLLEDETDSDSSLGDHSNRNLTDLQDGKQDEQAMPLSEVESLVSDDEADIVPQQRLTINNTSALHKARTSFSLPYSKLPFSAHQTVTTSAPVTISNIDDDLNRELAFYSQCKDAANQGRSLLTREGLPFSRPRDYFAEMVKSDEHMGKIKQKIVDDFASKKASSEARRQRDLKKFGKQVQIAKLQERDKAKRDMMNKIDLLKRKRKNLDTDATNEESMFDVALEDAVDNSRGAVDDTRNRGVKRQASQTSRTKREAKFGFGGKKRFGKSNDAVSTAEIRGYSAKKMKGHQGGSMRLGKSKRAKRL